MKDFFNVMSLEAVLGLQDRFSPLSTEQVPLSLAHGRILASALVSDSDLPDFPRSTMDGYAVSASSTFGASDGSPAWLTIAGSVAMGEAPTFTVGPGQAARIATGGMLPPGTDSVVMIEHTEKVDDTTIEVYKSVAPGQHIIDKGEDYEKGHVILETGQVLRPQETGLLAAFGIDPVTVYKQPRIGIISTGDEVVPVSQQPPPGHIRDINTYTLQGLAIEAGGIPVSYGIVKDNEAELFDLCSRALSENDMVLISGGSSVGLRDFTTSVLERLPDSSVLVHGISISPGKPTLMAQAGHKAVWGLPGHVVSAMIVFDVVVKPFVRTLAGQTCMGHDQFVIPAVLTRNVASGQGREEYIRVRLIKDGKNVFAEPVLGKSGTLNTMIHADGLIRIPLNSEGLDKGAPVQVRLFRCP